jgi:hypothetical protein
MNFSGLVSAVQEFWNFFWPAAVSLVLLLGIVRGVAPNAAVRIAAGIAKLKPTPKWQVSAFKIVKRFGIDKLIPVFAAFCLLFLMDVAKTMVVFAGDALPPTISYRYDLWFLQHASDERLQCLWAHYDDSLSLSDFQNNLERSLSEFETTHKDSQVFANIQNWQRQSGAAHQGFSACKFLIVWAALWTLAEILLTRRPYRPIGALMLCSLLLFVAASMFLFRDIWAFEQQEFARLQAVEVFMFDKPPLCRALPPEKQIAYAEVVNTAQRVSDSSHAYRWWTVRMVDSYYFHWVKEQLFKPAGHGGFVPRMTPGVIGQDAGEIQGHTGP